MGNDQSGQIFALKLLSDAGSPSTRGARAINFAGQEQPQLEFRGSLRMALLLRSAATVTNASCDIHETHKSPPPCLWTADDYISYPVARIGRFWPLPSGRSRAVKQLGKLENLSVPEVCDVFLNEGC
jgi:hypothetical protein